MATRWSSSSTNCRRFRCFAARVGVELVGFAYGFRTFEDEPWNDWYAEVLRAVGPVQGDTEHLPVVGPLGAEVFGELAFLLHCGARPAATRWQRSTESHPGHRVRSTRLLRSGRWQLKHPPGATCGSRQSGVKLVSVRANH